MSYFNTRLGPIVVCKKCNSLLRLENDTHNSAAAAAAAAFAEDGFIA